MLEELYNGTNGNNWNCTNTQWGDMGWQPCNEDQITCNENNTIITEIDLSGCNLDGSIDGLAWEVLEGLETLILDGNYIIGSIPSLFPDTLKHLDISINQLTGDLPNFSGTNLQYLYLNHNQLSGTFPALNMSHLLLLYINNNSLSGDLPDFVMPQLEVLSLESNGLTGQLPNFSLLPNLQQILLRHNQFGGSLPAWNNFTDLQRIDLRNNAISGTIPDYTLPKLDSLLLGENNLTGNLPMFTGAPLLTLITIKSNFINGTLPNLVLEYLQQLYLTNNLITGELPVWENLTSLNHLDLSNNSISGTLPEWDTFRDVMHTIKLGHNELYGPLPSWDHFTAITTLDLSFNNFSGEIPDWEIDIQELNLKQNQFCGNYPADPPGDEVDLSENQLQCPTPNWCNNANMDCGSCVNSTCNQQQCFGTLLQLDTTISNTTEQPFNDTQFSCTNSTNAKSYYFEPNPSMEVLVIDFQVTGSAYLQLYSGDDCDSLSCLYGTECLTNNSTYQTYNVENDDRVVFVVGNCGGSNPNFNLTVKNCSSPNIVTNGECIIECVPNCNYCEEPNVCITCEANYTLQGDQCVLETCQEGFYRSALGECQLCNPNCKNCEGQADNCTECIDGSYLKQCIGDMDVCNEYSCNVCPSQCRDGCIAPNGGCCPDGYYYFQSNCLMCNETCATCSRSASNCTSCNNYFYNNQCYDRCPDGTYPTNDTCAMCSANCRACDGSATNCTACPQNMVLLPNSTCNDSCPQNMVLLPNSTCNDSCPPDMVLLENRTCSDDCPTGTYKQLIENQFVSPCEQCNETCFNCTGPSGKDCVSCSPPKILVDGECLTSCPDGYFLQSLACIRCEDNCKTCTLSASTCTTCEAPLLLQNEACVHQCSAGFCENQNECIPCTSPSTTPLQSTSASLSLSESPIATSDTASPSKTPTPTFSTSLSLSETPIARSPSASPAVETNTRSPSATFSNRVSLIPEAPLPVQSPSSRQTISGANSRIPSVTPIVIATPESSRSAAVSSTFTNNIFCDNCLIGNVNTVINPRPSNCQGQGVQVTTQLGNPVADLTVPTCSSFHDVNVIYVTGNTNGGRGNVGSTILDITVTDEFGNIVRFLPEPLEICLYAEDVDDNKNNCLGYYDEMKREWICEDECLKQTENGVYCGVTDHLTSFALLLDNGSGGGGDPCESETPSYLIAYLSIGAIILAILFIIGSVILIEVLARTTHVVKRRAKTTIEILSD